LTHSCEEALDALALVVAVTLDPSSALGREPGGEPADSSGGQPTPPALENPPDRNETRRPEVESHREQVAPPRGTPSGSWRTFHVGVGLGLEGIYGPPPGVLPGGSLFFRVGWDRRSVWSPSVIVSGTHFQRDGYRAAGGTADFALDQLRLELCPLAQGQQEVRLHYCAMGTLGELRAAGVRTYEPVTRRRPWWVLGLSAVLTVRPTRALEFTAGFAVGRPMVRDSFEFVPDTIYTVRGISLNATLGVGVILP
jgi:hypothetical protein